MGPLIHALWASLADFMVDWHAAKVLVEDAVPISHDILHLVIGLMAYLLLALVMRRPLTSWWPWLWTFVIILWNETVDLWTEVWPYPGMQYREGIKDLALTMLLPTLLLAASRVLRHRPKDRVSDSQ